MDGPIDFARDLPLDALGTWPACPATPPPLPTADRLAEALLVAHRATLAAAQVVAEAERAHATTLAAERALRERVLVAMRREDRARVDVAGGSVVEVAARTRLVGDAVEMIGAGGVRVLLRKDGA
jgi:hypothetical protein